MSAAAKRSTRACAVPALAAALILVEAPRSASAAPARTSSLGWTRLPGAEACPGGRELALDVEARLGHPAFVGPSAAELTLEGRVEVAPAPSAFRATIRLLDHEGLVLGTRELETADPTCRDLADPLGLAIALMIDPEAATPEPAPDPAPDRRLEAPPPWVGAPQLNEPGGAEPRPVDLRFGTFRAELSPPRPKSVQMRHLAKCKPSRPSSRWLGGSSTSPPSRPRSASRWRSRRARTTRRRTTCHRPGRARIPGAA